MPFLLPGEARPELAYFGNYLNTLYFILFGIMRELSIAEQTKKPQINLLGCFTALKVIEESDKYILL